MHIPLKANIQFKFAQPLDTTLFDDLILIKVHYNFGLDMIHLF